MSDALIQLEGVGKSFRYFRLDDIRLEVAPGQIMGLIGPNGAGKSTTIRILMGFVRHDCGRVRLLGHDIPAQQAKAKLDVGFASEDMRLYPQASIAWHARMIANIYAGWDAAYAEQLLARFNLHWDQPIKALSHGERTKAMLLLVLARRPRLLVLDEPTTGLDPVARHEILAEFMDILADESRGVLFSSQNTHDIEQISDAITFIDRGRVIDCNDKETFLERWRRIALDLPPSGTLPEVPGVVEARIEGHVASVVTNAFTPGFVSGLTGCGAVVRDVQRLSLEEIFVANVMYNRRRENP